MKSITLRPATMEDAEALFHWKNEEEVRRNSIESHEEISWEKHLVWLEDWIDYIQIITDGETDYGDIRLEPEVAIKVDKKYRGKGIAKTILKKVVKKGMIARIVNGNIASMRLFIGLGFKPIDYREGHYILQK